MALQEKFKRGDRASVPALPGGGAPTSLPPFFRLRALLRGGDLSAAPPLVTWVCFDQLEHEARAQSICSTRAVTSRIVTSWGQEVTGSWRGPGVTGERTDWSLSWLRWRARPRRAWGVTGWTFYRGRGQDERRGDKLEVLMWRIGIDKF